MGGGRVSGGRWCEPGAGARPNTLTSPQLTHQREAQPPHPWAPPTVRPFAHCPGPPPCPPLPLRPTALPTALSTCSAPCSLQPRTIRPLHSDSSVPHGAAPPSDASTHHVSPLRHTGDKAGRNRTYAARPTSSRSFSPRARLLRNRTYAARPAARPRPRRTPPPHAPAARPATRPRRTPRHTPTRRNTAPRAAAAVCMPPTLRAAPLADWTSWATWAACRATPPCAATRPSSCAPRTASRARCRASARPATAPAAAGVRNDGGGGGGTGEHGTVGVRGVRAPRATNESGGLSWGCRGHTPHPAGPLIERLPPRTANRDHHLPHLTSMLSVPTSTPFRLHI